MSGLNFLATLKNPPMVILVTAFPNFALEGFEADVADSVSQIIIAVNQRFVRILLVEFVVGSIFGYLFTSKFIFQFIFEYHPDAGPEPYIGTFLAVTLCCCIIIGSKVYHAATANPIERLRAD